MGNVLVPLNGIRNQKQFCVRQGSAGVEFHANHLSTTPDWGEAVLFVRYIPTSPMWVAPQMGLKSATKTPEDKDAGSEDGHEDEEVTVNSNHTVTLSKYKKANMDDGFHYFRDEDKLLWVKFFENQEKILKTYLKSA